MNRDRPTQDQWAASLPSLRRKGSDLVGPCPACGDGVDRFYVRQDGGAFCRQCCPDGSDGEAFKRLLAAAGFEVAAKSHPSDTDGPMPPAITRLVFGGRNGQADATVQRWHLQEADGDLVAIHCRQDQPDGSKRVWWEQPGGARGLAGRKAADLPLYGIHQIAELPDAMPTAGIVVEGEKAADALRKQARSARVSVLVLGTVTGAASAPSADVLRQLLPAHESAGTRHLRENEREPVYLWPDNDDSGREHMRRIGATLVEIGVDPSLVRVINWEGAPEKGDAADWAARQQPALVDLLAAAQEYEGEGIAKNGKKPVITKDSKGLEQALASLGYEWRYNLRAVRFQARPKADGGPWLDLNDRKIAALREEIADLFRFAGTKSKGKSPALFGRDSWTDAMNALAWRSEVDPFAEYLDALPTWDAGERIDSWLQHVFVIEDNAELVTWASRALLLGAVARTREPGYKLDEMIVLVGPQGCGKSTAVQWLLPAAERDEWFNDGLHLADIRKEQAEALQGVVFCESAEMAGTNRAELESLKAFVSRTNDRVRLAYRRDPESLPRRCIIVGTTNDEQPLPNDPTGNRRFVPVKVAGRPRGAAVVREYLDAHREQLWAEAIHAWNSGARPWLPADLVPVQHEHNVQFRRDDEMLENRLDGWLSTAPEGFELSQAAAGCDLIADEGNAAKLSRRDALRLASALRNFGYEKKKERFGSRTSTIWRRR